MSDNEYASPKIAKAFRDHFGSRVKPIKVDMKHARVVATFIRQVDAAHKATANSRLVFK